MCQMSVIFAEYLDYEIQEGMCLLLNRLYCSVRVEFVSNHSCRLISNFPFSELCIHLLTIKNHVISQRDFVQHSFASFEMKYHNSLCSYHRDSPPSV